MDGIEAALWADIVEDIGVLKAPRFMDCAKPTKIAYMTARAIINKRIETLPFLYAKSARIHDPNALFFKIKIKTLQQPPARPTLGWLIAENDNVVLKRRTSYRRMNERSAMFSEQIGALRSTRPRADDADLSVPCSWPRQRSVSAKSGR